MATTFPLTLLFRQSVGFDCFNDLFESALRSEAEYTCASNQNARLAHSFEWETWMRLNRPPISSHSLLQSN